MVCSSLSLDYRCVNFKFSLFHSELIYSNICSLYLGPSNSNMEQTRRRDAPRDEPRGAAATRARGDSSDDASLTREKQQS